MRWYSIVSLFSNSRVRFLLGFIVVATVVATVLIFIEVILRKRKERVSRKVVEDAPIHKLREFLAGDRAVMEKLDFLNKTVKEYFKKFYGMPVSSDYSFLIKKFEKDRKEKEHEFCKEMFESYYSSHGLTDRRTIELGNLFIRIFNERRRAEETYKMPSVFDKIELFFERKMREISVRNYKRALEKQERKVGKKSEIGIASRIVSDERSRLGREFSVF